MEGLILLVLLVGIVLATSEKACMLISHGLNVIFRLPHPGPNDIQGSCWCRRHEGPSRYKFSDYINHLLE